MNVSDVYLSENSQLVSDSSQEWMHETVLVEENDLMWQNATPEITVDYSENIANQTNADDDYLTADDSGEATQYFSILDPNYDEEISQMEEADYAQHEPCVKIEVNNEEQILPDQLDEGEQESQDKTPDGQILVYRDEKNDEYYAVQSFADGSGNVQRYQYKVRQLPDGQFTAIPETVEVHTMEHENVLKQDSSTKSELNAEKSKKVAEEPTIEEADSDELNSDDGEVEYLLSEDEEMENLFLDETDLEDPIPNQILSMHIPEIRMDLSEESNNEYETKSSVCESGKTVSVDQPVTPKYVKPNVIKPRTKYEPSTKLKKDTNASAQISIRNPRSLLKSNFLSPKEKADNVKPPVNGKENLKVSELQKYLMKPKETVAKAARQPRKQTIKPVERADSEIVVQPLYFTGDGRVIESFYKSNFPLPNEVLQVSDDTTDISDDESNTRQQKKLNKRGRPRLKIAEITISDSDSSDVEIYGEEIIENPVQSNVIVNLDEDSNDETLTNAETNISKLQTPVALDSNTPPTNHESTPASADAVSITSKAKQLTARKNFKCPICPKTFPRQLTLRAHMNIHSIRRNLRNKSSVVAEPKRPNAQLRLSPRKAFKCVKCKINFLTESQYNRHQSVHVRTNISTDNLPANKPIRVPIRSPLRRLTQRNSNTLLTRMTKKLVSSPLISKKPIATNVTFTNKSLRKPTPRKNLSSETFKCTICHKSFQLLSLLNAHKRNHQLFPCLNCQKKFVTKPLLDDHVRKNCIGKSPNKKLLQSNRKITRNSLKCSLCTLSFESAIILARHVKNVHAIKSPGTRNSQRVVRSRGAHGGVPPSQKLQKAFDKMKLKS